MNRHILSAIATLIAATVAAAPSRANDVSVHISDSLVPRSSSVAIESVRNALTSYTSACKAKDRQGIAHAMTADAEIEYTVDVPGQYLAVDLNSLDACWGARQSMNSDTGAAEVWIYLTPSPDVVFVDLVTVEGVGPNAHRSEQLAMIKMSAGRITQIRDFSAPRAIRAFTVNEIDPANRN